MIIKLLKAEPALIYGLLGSLIALATTFGLNLTVEQSGAIMAAASAILALIVRSQVVPTSDVTPIERNEP